VGLQDSNLEAHQDKQIIVASYMARWEPADKLPTKRDGCRRS
jgi:hypothetical protein